MALEPDTGEIQNRFAENVRRLREAKGLSQEELAFAADIHRTQVGLMESGQRLPRLDTLVKLAGALGVTANDLLDGVDWEPSVQQKGRFAIAAGGADA
jgi:transcriptional regulator with XRE-family HTH domain